MGERRLGGGVMRAYMHADTVRADYVIEDVYASLGVLALDRGPLAFLPENDRPKATDLERYLPPMMTLPEAGMALAKEGQ